MSDAIALVGDIQMTALAHVLRSLESLGSSREIVYAADEAELNGSAAFVVEQRPLVASPPKRKRARGVRYVTVPTLYFPLLWPLAIPNAEDRSGRHPWTDAFVVAAKRQGLTRDAVAALYRAASWGASWPDLDGLFSGTTKMLLAADAAADVKIGSFVLKHFRKRRLFWAPNAPSNVLLGEVAFRTLHACFGNDLPVAREELVQSVASLGALDLMSRASLPIHPFVASHFALAWYHADERYPSQGDARTFDEYLRDLLDVAFGASQ
ncbi:MAG: hypothetical protein KGN02_14135 [bacterium]|nr:hypothetical protein [bacterium]